VIPHDFTSTGVDIVSRELGILTKVLTKIFSHMPKITEKRTQLQEAFCAESFFLFMEKMGVSRFENNYSAMLLTYAPLPDPRSAVEIFQLTLPTALLEILQPPAAIADQKLGNEAGSGSSSSSSSSDNDSDNINDDDSDETAQRKLDKLKASQRAPKRAKKSPARTKVEEEYARLKLKNAKK